MQINSLRLQTFPPMAVVWFHLEASPESELFPGAFASIVGTMPGHHLVDHHIPFRVWVVGCVHNLPDTPQRAEFAIAVEPSLDDFTRMFGILFGVNLRQFQKLCNILRGDVQEGIKGLDGRGEVFVGQLVNTIHGLNGCRALAPHQVRRIAPPAKEKIEAKGDQQDNNHVEQHRIDQVSIALTEA